MAIIVINRTPVPINSATSSLGLNHSVHNEICTNQYYIHDTNPGTHYDIRINWFHCGHTQYRQQIKEMIGLGVGVPLALLGLAVVIADLSVGPKLSATFVLGAISTVGGGILSGAMWSIDGVSASGDVTQDKKASTWASTEDVYYQAVADFELTPLIDNTGNITGVRSKDPGFSNLRLEAISKDQFETWLKEGLIHQAIHPLASDIAGMLFLNTEDADRGYSGGTFHSNKTYLIRNHHPLVTNGFLIADPSESDDRSWRIEYGNQTALSAVGPEGHWQLIPVRNTPNRLIFALAERRFSKFLVHYKNPGSSQSSRRSLIHTVPIVEVAKYFNLTGINDEVKHPSLAILPRNGAMTIDDGVGDFSVKWLPFFELIPDEAHPDHYFIATAYLHDIRDAFNPTKERTYVAARDDHGTDMHSYRGHDPESYDSWQFIKV